MENTERKIAITYEVTEREVVDILEFWEHEATEELLDDIFDYLKNNCEEEIPDYVQQSVIYVAQEFRDRKDGNNE